MPALKSKIMVSTTKPSNRIAVNLSANVVVAFKEKGQNWQSKIDTVLQDWLRTNAA